MSNPASILLLADAATAQRLDEPEAVDFTHATDPFEALESLAQRPRDAVLVSLPRPDQPELLASIRKLCPETRLYGLCTPRGEYELRVHAGRLESMVDDYFLIPPTDAEWDRIRQGAEQPEAEHAAPAPTVEAGLTTRQITELIDSTVSPARLTRCVAKLVGDACGCTVRWSQADGGRAGVQRLLTMDTDPPQTLWAADVLEPDGARQAWLSALRAQLPSLAAVAHRGELLRKMATTDHLTGAHNRRYFMHFAERMLESVRKRRQRATLLVYDIDDFKLYNDAYGHAAGDEILKETAAMMRQITRQHDLVARIGGDEFAVLFCELEQPRQPGSKPLQTAYDLANRFRQAVNSHSFQSLGPQARGTLTISGGLAAFPWDGLTIDQLMARADEALLTAKRGGKNNIYLIGGLAYDDDAVAPDQSHRDV